MGHRHADYFAEFVQVGRIAVWESLERFQGETTDSFFAFAYRTAECNLRGAVRRELGLGTDDTATWIFTNMLNESDGDPAEAVKLAQTAPPAGRRLSADRAWAALRAYQGTEPLGEIPQNAAPAPESRTSVRVGVLLDALGPQQRAVLKMTYGIGDSGRMSTAEIAEELGIPRTAVASAKKKGQARLAQLWERAAGSFLLAA
ncbi:RNA polymerase sigma factor, sigma-70 family [Streptomyces sp. Cmuel-A718b]|nr:RNA polymerase sigma factor, sigma-70 family [Streptomyces sp. Cmuel-A718b]